jgi:hypothetical protein
MVLLLTESCLSSGRIDLLSTGGDVHEVRRGMVELRVSNKQY